MSTVSARHLLKLLLPQLDPERSRAVNLNSEGRNWCEMQNLTCERSCPLIEPSACSTMIAWLHARLNIDWSYGGYLEDRREIWRGSYLSDSGNFIHLGVDLNVPAETIVSLTYQAQVVVADHDEGVNWGWGPRLIMRPTIQAKRDTALIYAHLDGLRHRVGEVLPAGTILGKVGLPPINGNWFPHLHIQAVGWSVLEGYLRTGLERLDGYGHPTTIDQLSRDYPDPLLELGSLS